MKAVILVGGYGRRLRPLTHTCPKVMLPVKGRPLLEYQIEWLTRFGISDLLLSLHYLPHTIPLHFGDGTRFGTRITYALEKEPAGPAGCLHRFRGELKDTFLVHEGDVYSELDIAGLLAFHKDRNPVATVALRKVSRFDDCDFVTLAADARVQSVHCRPGTDLYGDLGNAGTRILEPKVMEYIPKRECAFFRDVLPEMLRRGERVCGYIMNEFVEDIGTFERYHALLRRLE